MPRQYTFGELHQPYFGEKEGFVKLSDRWYPRQLDFLGNKFTYDDNTSNYHHDLYGVRWPCPVYKTGGFFNEIAIVATARNTYCLTLSNDFNIYFHQSGSLKELSKKVFEKIEEENIPLMNKFFNNGAIEEIEKPLSFLGKEIPCIGFEHTNFSLVRIDYAVVHGRCKMYISKAFDRDKTYYAVTFVEKDTQEVLFKIEPGEYTISHLEKEVNKFVKVLAAKNDLINFILGEQ